MSGREKGKTSIRTALQQSDTTLYHRLETIWIAIAREIQELQHSREGHQQGPLHCGMVEDNLGKLIPDDQKSNFFTPLELFLLSAAACYHDIGKSIVSMKKHGKIAMDEMLDKAKNYGLTDPEGLVLSYIVGAHDSDEAFNDVPENYHVANEDVRVRLLSSLLRLADILHSDNSRIPHLQVGEVKKEDEKTRFRKLIPGWGFDKNSQIELTAVPENYNDLNIIQNGVSMMQKEIECIAPVLRDAGYPYKISIHYDNRKLLRKSEEKIRPELLEMDYYTEKEASIFRGRNIESQELLDKVFSSKASGNYTTLLVGNSGVGKTSLIRAGLFPILINMGWKCIWTRPLNPDPLKRIYEDISNACKMDSSGSGDIFSCIKKLSDNCAGTGVLISIDQFEDILRSQPHEREQIGKILRRIYSKSFWNVHVLLSYRGDYEPEIFSFFENASITRPEKYSLRGFDRQVASDVLRELFRDNNIGIDDVLLVNILNEIDKISEIGGIYPPFIQIIAKSLIESAKSNDGVVTEELYCIEGKVEDIIGYYLIFQLKYFDDLSPPKAKFAEEILKQLVRDRTKEQKGKDELLRYLMLPENELQELLDLMMKKRLIRHLGNDNYEIIHDFLASSVEGMIKNDERLLRSAISTLRTKALNYEHIPSLLDNTEMMSLYSLKEAIHPSIQEKELLMFSYLAGNGPAWWWLREDKDLLQTFIKKGLSNTSKKVRGGAVAVFGELGTRGDFSIIAGMLKDIDLEVRIEAIRAFEKLGTHDDLTIIMDILNDKDKTVREIAAEIFIKLVAQENLPLIKKMLKNKQRNLRAIAISAFGKLSTHDDLPTLNKILKEDRAKDVRIAAIKVFEDLGNHSDLPTLIEMFEDKHEDVKAAAIMAFGKLGKHVDIDVVKVNLQNPNTNWKIKKAAGCAFIDLASREDRETIEGMLEDKDGNTRWAAVGSFVKYATIEDLETRKSMLKDRNWDVKKTLVTAFGKLGNHGDIPTIKEMLKDGDSGVRKASVIAFNKLSTHEDIPTIKDMLKDPNPGVRLAAAISLQRLGDEKDLQQLITKYANGEINNEECLKCIIALDEKLFSPKKEFLSLHKKDL